MTGLGSQHRGRDRRVPRHAGVAGGVRPAAGMRGLPETRGDRSGGAGQSAAGGVSARTEYDLIWGKETGAPRRGGGGAGGGASVVVWFWGTG